MNAKIGNFNEMEKVLNIKGSANAVLMSLFDRFGLGN